MFYYFAGGLFDHKELVGNHLLAEAILQCSGGRWEPLLPQTVESQERPDAREIRDSDLAMVLQADAALFNFDGLEVDSGTVVEFMAARVLDLPCVLFRTDFRSTGDQKAGGDPWNLMLSGYPRTVTLRYDSMNRYQALFPGRDTADALKLYYDEMARAIVEKLDAVYNTPPVYQSETERRTARDLLIRTCGIMPLQ